MLNNSVDLPKSQDDMCFKKKDLKLKLANAIYVCQCDKKFLSFPAIYSHAKNKHNVKLTSKITSGNIKKTVENKQKRLFFKLNQNLKDEDNISNQGDNFIEPDNIANSATNFKFIRKITKIYNTQGNLNIYGVASKFLQHCSINPIEFTLLEISDTILLLTQCINSHYMLFDNKQVHQNYCQYQDGNMIPVFLNFFIIWYLPTNKKKHLQINKDLKMIQIGQILDSFCRWLKQEGYTSFECQFNSQFMEYESDKQSQSLSIKKLSPTQ